MALKNFATCISLVFDFKLKYKVSKLYGLFFFFFWTLVKCE